MVIVGLSGIFYYCDPMNPGSYSDSPILMTSPVPEQMEEWLSQDLPFPEAMIGGDSIFQTNLPCKSHEFLLRTLRITKDIKN